VPASEISAHACRLSRQRSVRCSNINDFRVQEQKYPPNGPSLGIVINASGRSAHSTS